MATMSEQAIVTNLLHDACLSLGECRVPPELVVDEFHLDFHTTFGLLAIGWWCLLCLGAVLATRSRSSIIHGAVAHTDCGHGNIRHHGILLEVESCHIS